MTGTIPSINRDAQTLGGAGPEAYAQHGGAIMARLNADVSTSARVKLPLAQVDNSNEALFEVVDGSIRVKKGGYVVFSASAMVAGGGSGKYMGITADKNGRTIGDSYGTTGTMDYGVPTVLTRMVSVSAGDVISLYFNVTASTPVIIQGSERTSLTMWAIT